MASALLLLLLMVLCCCCCAAVTEEACTLPSWQTGRCVKLDVCKFYLQAHRTSTSTDELNKRIEWCGGKASGLICCEEALPTMPVQSTTPVITNKQHSNYKLFDKRNCGFSYANRIANGEQANLLEFPWAARLGYQTRSKSAIVFNCGASLISDFYVLTAAHCLVFLPSTVGKLALVRLGEFDERTAVDCLDGECADAVQDVRVERFVAHSAYDRKTFQHDIGIVRLAEAAKTKQNNIKPICLPFDAAALPAKFLVIGWGKTETASKSAVLLKASVPFYELSECREKFSEKNQNILLSDFQFCAGGEQKIDACKGDSGQSIQYFQHDDDDGVDGKARMVQFGIVSYGIASCGKVEGFPGVYTKVFEYLDWILNNIN